MGAIRRPLTVHTIVAFIVLCAYGDNAPLVLGVCDGLAALGSHYKYTLKPRKMPRAVPKHPAQLQHRRAVIRRSLNSTYQERSTI
jgi:hypothetical protein